MTQEEISLLKKDPFEFRNNKDVYREKCFLWVIDENHLKIIREKTRNIKRSHDSNYVCHTNLTGGKKAYIGGEILFGDDDNYYINHFSDRYGGNNVPRELWQVTKKIFQELGYQNLIDILDLIE